MISPVTTLSDDTETEKTLVAVGTVIWASVEGRFDVGIGIGATYN
jgi:hypothetical protein